MESSSGRTRSPRLEIERRGVHAVAQPRRLGAVVEDVAEVRAAAAAEDLGARGEEAAVLFRLDARLRQRRPEARPTRPRIELGLRAKQGMAARAADIGAGLVMVPVLSR